MRRLGKRLIIILSVLLVIGIGLISYNLMAQSAEVSNEKKTDEITTTHASENSDPGDIDKSPFTKYITMENVDDAFMQTHIHWMSHQKVEASDKWGFELMTDERITWLLQALDKADLEHENTYREILERWEDEDFTKVDQDHNKVWELQEGRIGEATKILTISEEQALLEEMKYKDCYDCKETGLDEKLE